MKRVSLEAAKAIAKAGYWCKYGHRCKVQEIVNSEQLLLNADYSLLSVGVPTYLEVWLWLWREKKLAIPIFADCGFRVFGVGFNNITGRMNDPEEAIIEAIKYLVDNNLIK